MVTFANRAKVSTATTGAGTITLGAAELRSQTFGGAGLVDGDVVRYTIEDGNNFEIGTGTYTASGTTLSRTPSESSNGGAAINLSGVAVVFVTVAAEDLDGALNALVFDTRALAGEATIKPTANMIWVGTAAGSYLCFEATSSNPALTTAGGRTWRPASALDTRVQHWGVATHATKAAALAALDAMSGAERAGHQTALEAAFLHTSGVLLVDGWVEAIDEIVVGNACTPDLLGGIAGEQLIGGIYCGSRFNLLADSVVTAGATGVGSYAPYIKAMSISLDQSASETAAQVAYDAAIAGAPGDVPAAVAAGIVAFAGAIIDYPKPFVGKEAFGLLETMRVTGMTKPTTWTAPTFTPGSGNLDNIGGWEVQNLQLSGYNQRLRVENGFHFLKVGRIDDWVWDLGARAQDYRNRDITAGVKSEAIYFGRLDSLIVDHIGIFAAGQIVIDKGEGNAITDQIGTVQLDGHFSSLTLRSGRTQFGAIYGTEDVSAASLPHKILCESGSHIIASGSLLGNSDALIKVTGGRLEYDGIIRNTNINGHGGLVTAGQLVFDGAHFVIGVVGSFGFADWNVGYLEQSGTGEMIVTANCTAEQYTSGGVVQGPAVQTWQIAKVTANNPGCNVLPAPRSRVDMVQALSGSDYNLYPVKGSQVYPLDGVHYIGVGGTTVIADLPGLLLAQGLFYSTRAAFVSAVAGGADYATGAVVFADGIGYLKVASSTAISDLLNFIPHDRASPVHWGADRSGVSDSLVATEAALTYLATLGGGVLYYPAGSYLYGGASAGWVDILSSVEIVGDGVNDSILNYKTQNGGQGFFFASDSGAGWNISMKDISLVGSWGDGGDYTTTTGQLFRATVAGDVTLDNVMFKNCSFMATAVSGANFFSATNVQVINAAADGIRATNTKRLIVSNCYIENCNDDAIALHTLDSGPDPVDISVTVTGNVLVDSQGIAIIGAKHTTITGNVITRPIVRGIFVGGKAGTEGNTAPISINITGNKISDCFRGFVFSNISGSGGEYIIVQMEPPTPVGGTGTDYVGSSDGSGGVVEPWSYIYTNNTDASKVIAGAYWLNISDNICTRTLKPTANYSDYGFGSRLSRTGPSNPAIVATDIVHSQIMLKESYRDTKVSGNILSGGEYGIDLVCSTTIAAAQYNNVSITGNIVTNFSTRGINISGPGLLQIKANSFDGDPYNIHADRVANGKWGAGFANNTGLFILTAHAIITDNSFRNVGRVIGGTLTEELQWDGNQIICDPNGTGTDADNIGIRGIAEPSRYGYIVVEDGDPASANFNRAQQPCLLVNNGPPTTGTYVRGHFTRNALPTILGTGGSQYIITGWVRITTGSAHVLDTDWSPVYGTSAILDILGTVSESGGVPTGSIIERGSNANGEYVRFADGTQICVSKISVDVTSTALQTASLPAIFAGNPISVSASNVDNSANSALYLTNIQRAYSTTAVYAFRIATAGTSTAPTADSEKLIMSATGRWF
jgi:hypothetical protein